MGDYVITAHAQFQLKLSEREDRYLDSCCKIRNVTRTMLMLRLLTRIMQDELVLSVLDDDSKPIPKKHREHPYRPKKKAPGVEPGALVSLEGGEGGVEAVPGLVLAVDQRVDLKAD